MRKKAFVLILCLLLSFFATQYSVFQTYASEEEKEFEDNVLFQKKYLDLPTWKKKWTKDLGTVGVWPFEVDLGEIETKVFFSLGHLEVKLPATLKAKYDTTISPMESNTVYMTANTTNGDGLEFEFTIGFDAYIKWKTDIGDLTVGDFPTGFDWEGDFVPPLGDGEEVYTTSDGAAASIGTYKIVSLDVGVDIRFKIEGIEIIGGCWLDDDYCILQDSSTKFPPSGILINSKNNYAEQFGIYHNVTSPSLPYDGYVDFGVNNLFYHIKFTVQIAPTIGLSAAGVSWSHTIDYWVDLFSIEDYVPLSDDDSDDTSYQMTRELGGKLEPECGIILLDIGKVLIKAKIEAGISSEGVYVTLDLSIQIRLIIRNPELLKFDHTTVDMIFENGSRITIPISNSSFLPANTCRWIDIDNIYLLESSPGTEYHHLDFVLDTPMITSPVNYTDYVDQSLIPTPSARLMFVYDLPDLKITRLNFSVLETEPETNMYTVDATIKNTGNVNSTLPTDVRLWIYEGVPEPPTDFEALIDDATYFPPPQPLRPLGPNEEENVTFTWTADPTWIGKYVTFIIVVDRDDIVPENSEANNKAAATAYIMSRQHDIAVTELSGVPMTIQKGGTISPINVTITNEGQVTEENIIVELWANENLIDSQTVLSLASDANATVGPFSWTANEKGIFDISARVNKLTGEYDACDNTKMTPVTIVAYDHDVAVINITTSENEVVQNKNLTISVEVANMGSNTESFNVSLYYDNNPIGDPASVSDLISGNQTILTFIWNTTGVTPNSYTIKAEATQVPDEGDKDDNTLTDGTVTVRPPPDIAVTNILVPRKVARPGYEDVLTINVTVENQGEYHQTFNVVALTCYPFQTITITDLPPHQATILTFTLNIVGIGKGNHTISAHALSVLNETDTADNKLTDWVFVTRAGDLGGGLPPDFFKCDDKVDGLDLALFVACYKKSAPPEVIYLADLGGGLPPQFYQCDGKVDGMDLALFIQCYKGLGPDP